MRLSRPSAPRPRRPCVGSSEWAFVFTVLTILAAIFTGARLYYSLGRELPALGRIGLWEERSNMPVNAIIAQSAIALALVVFGASTRVGFRAMVEYTAPVFWFFLLLAGVPFTRPGGATSKTA